MTTHLFLIVVSVIAGAVGVFAVGFPVQLLGSKGAAVSPAAVVWVREVGVNIFAQGVAAFLMRDQPDSATLRAFFIGSAVVQFGLFPIEIIAWRNGTITRLSGIVPNSVLHLVLGSAFVFFALH
ncbi:MAG: hypothetical protein Q8L14_16745 [Myxococcales bacterium]|nr:hypothetical protein [Myxococcales bacterium]